VPRILVVDDEPLISMLVENWLTELGCEVAGPARSVQDGLDLVTGTELDGAILDINLGNEKSYLIADALRQRNVPIAFATGDGLVGAALSIKDPLLLHKPFDFEKVKAVLGKLLDRTPKVDGQ
jgi:DNA-binding response OmpR family regulator